MRSHCVQFVCWWWAHATRRQGIFNAKEGEISFHYLCFSNRPFILGILEWNANAAYVIDFEKKPWCSFAFSTATVRVYIERTSFQNGKKHLRVAQNFYHIRPQTTRKSTHHLLWLVKLSENILLLNKKKRTNVKKWKLMIINS